MSIGSKCITEWDSVKSSVRNEIGDDAFKSWIAALIADDLTEGTLTVGAPSKFVCDRVSHQYGEVLKRHAAELDDSVEKLEFCVSAACATGKTQPKPRAQVKSREKAKPREGGNAFQAASGRLQSISLNRKFQFDSFVVGRPNEFAHAAAKRVAESENAPFNPLFLYGQSGLGKTHLMHSIAWRRLEMYPEETFLFISAETFLMEFVAALRHQTTMDFKEMLRSVDVLIVDDVQHIVGKDRTQEEFFHTFNALTDQHRQIIISADCSPNDMRGLDDRLRSRLGWGLVADIHPTDYELRRGILEAKAESALESSPSLEIEPSLLDFLAHRISSDVRTLEGALNRLFAYASLTNRAATIELAQRELTDLLKRSDRKVSIEEIQRIVCEHYNLRMSDMLSPKRSRSIARPRQIAMSLSKNLTQKSLPEIGRKFGGRDHTTVLHAIRTVDKIRCTDSAFDEEVERLRRKLEGC